MSVDPVLFIVLLVTPILPTLWAILDIPKRRFSTNRKRLVWFWTVATLPFVGAVFYILFARRHTQRIESM